MSIKKILQKAAADAGAGKPGVLGIVTSAVGSTPASTGRMIFITPAEIRGSVGGGITERKAIDRAREMMQKGESTANLEIDLTGVANSDGICGGSVSLLLVSVSGKTRVNLIGAGHVNQALSTILEELGYGVNIFDKRDVLPWNNYKKIGDYGDVLQDITPESGLVIACHSHDEDQEALRSVLKDGRHPSYFAVVSSKRKFIEITEELKAEGVEVPGDVYAPAGLDLNGNEPFEVALSIAAQMEKIYYKKTGLDLKDVKK